MLPHIQHEQRNGCNGDVALLIGQLVGHEALAQGVPCENGPAGALQAEGCSGELCLELLEGTEELVDGVGQIAFGARSAVAGHVRPEDRVVGVATQVEGQVLFPQVDCGKVTGFAGCFQLLQCSVCAGHVVGMVLVVVQLHDLCRDIGLQCRVIVGKFGKGVNAHRALLTLRG